MSRYFANGTEGYAWMAEWCERCANDHEFAHVEPHYSGGDGGCEILALSMLGDDREIPEWVDNSAVDGFTFPPAVHCIMFRRCTCDNGPDDPPDDPPPPVDPNQRVLFDADDLPPGVPRGVFLDVMERVDA